MINSIKLNMHFSSEAIGKNAFPHFEEIRLFMRFPSEAFGKIALPHFEENGKKPGGCFQWQ